ncbi:serine carboxypeptidase S28-domain-containing protein [Trichophaea hybrida]|nr:serine carboxypeptidase S28-domain-containing protein [Trichophaea hybrida]
MLFHSISLIFSFFLLSSHFHLASASSHPSLPAVRRSKPSGRADFYSHRRRLSKRQPGYYDDIPKVQYIELPLDHFGNGNGTFKNRYWVYDAAYKPGGPIIVDDAGESDAAPFAKDMKSSLTVSFANATGGIVINWEHRYYGESQPPVPGPSILQPEKLGEYYKYLTVEQALEDFVTFAKNFTYKGQDLNPGNVPWVFVGGSYPGARSAWLRQRNPEIVFVSYASSAVVEVSEQLPQYEEAIFHYYDTHGRKGCMDDLRGLIAWMSKVVENKDQHAYETFTRSIYRSQSSDIYHNYFQLSPDQGSNYWDRVKKTLDPMVDYVFADFQNGDHSVTSDFCDDLQEKAAKFVTYNQQHQRLVDHGLIEALGFYQAQTIMAGAFYDLFTELLADPGLETRDSTAASGREVEDAPAKDNKVDTDTSGDIVNGNKCSKSDKNACQKLITDNQGWFYQTCSELGYFFTKDDMPNRKPEQLSFRNVTYNIQDCVSLFGSSVARGPSLAPLKKYGGKKTLNPSNTYWVDGQYDPWRPTTVNALDSGRYPSRDIPESGKTLQGDNFFGAVVNDSYHVPLHSCWAIVSEGETKLDEPNPECKNGAEAQQLFLDALQEWLPKFEKHSLAIAKTGADRKVVNDVPVANKASSFIEVAGYSAGMLMLLAVAFVIF